MTDFLWSHPYRTHVAKIKLGCVLRMVLSCLRVGEQVFLMGLLWSVPFLLELSSFVFLSTPAALFPFTLSLPKKTWKRAKDEREYFELNVLCVLYDALQKLSACIRIAFLLMPCPVLLKDCLIMVVKLQTELKDVRAFGWVLFCYE